MTNHPQAASDEKILKAALEAGSIEAYTSGGIRRDFSFHEAQLRHYDAIRFKELHEQVESLANRLALRTMERDEARAEATANAESEHGEALKAEREVRVMLVEAIKLDLAWIEAERECPKQTTTFQQRVAMCGEAETAMVEALAAAQALDKKEG